MSEYRIQNTFSDRLIRNLHEDKEQEWSLTSIFFFKGPFAHDGNGNLVEQQRQKEPKIEKMIFWSGQLMIYLDALKSPPLHGFTLNLIRAIELKIWNNRNQVALQ